MPRKKMTPEEAEERRQTLQALKEQAKGYADANRVDREKIKMRTEERKKIRQKIDKLS